MTQHQKKSITDQLPNKLWAVAGASLAVLLLLALFIPKPWMPLVTFSIGYGLSWVDNVMNHGMLWLRVVKLTMYWTAFIMLLIVVGREIYPRCSTGLT